MPLTSSQRARYDKLARDPATRKKVPTKYLSDEHKRLRYQRLRRSPDTRRQVPDEYLSSRQRRVRALNARLNAPVTAGSQMTERELTRRSKAETDLRFGEAERVARTGVADARGRMDALPAYFEQYKADLDAARARLDAEAQATLGAAQGQQAVAQANVAQGAIADAGQFSGADMGQVQQDAAQAAALRGSLSSSARDVLAADFSGRARVLDAQRTSGVAGRRQEALQRAYGDLEKRLLERRDLAKERGDFDLSNREKLRGAERQSVLERLALNIDEADSIRKAAQDAADRKADAREKRRDREFRADESQKDRDAREDENRKDREAQERRDRERDAQRNKPGAPRQEPVFSRDSRNWVLGRSRTIADLAKKERIRSREDFKRATRESRKGWYSSQQALATSAALDLYFDGRISRQNLRRLRQMGVYVTSKGDYWGGGNRGS